MNQQLVSAWQQMAATLQNDNALPPSTLAFFNQATLLGELGTTVLIAVPNQLAKNYIEARLQKQILQILADLTGVQYTLAVTVDATQSEASDYASRPLDDTHDPFTPKEIEPLSTGEVIDSRNRFAGHSGNVPAGDNTGDAHRDYEVHDGQATEAAAGTNTATVVNLADHRRTTSDILSERGRVSETTLDNETTDSEQYPRPTSAAETGTNGEKVPADRNLAGNVTPDHLDQAHLNSKYTFETFVIGESNRFAHAAAVSVAENPAHSYNPLFIWGGSGLGKTHLLHAIGHYTMSLFPGKRVLYVNSEEFTNDFINSISSGKIEAFKGRYRNIDVLLIDDIQFLQGKEQTIEEFFHTFNALHNQEKQVVITSDVPPKKLDGFHERLRTRFTWGLLTDVQPPNLETRIAILQKKARSENVQADNEVLEYIASRFATNIRELEGALLRVTAFASLNKQPITLGLAEMVLKDIVSNPHDAEITAALIKAQTAAYFNFTVDQLCSADRSRNLAEARQIAMYLCRELTDLSLPKIGNEFNRDHTTVMHANKRIPKMMSSTTTTFNHVTELTNRIKQAARETE